MKNKYLIIHTGFQKTGSTAIQSFLTRNQEVLIESHFEYLDPARSKIGFQNHNHSHLAFALTGYWADSDYQLSPEDAWNELSERASISENHLIVSSELLSTPQVLPHVEFIKNSLRDHHVKVVFYLRRQDILAQSIYKERVKNSESRPFNEAFRDGDYKKVLDFKKTLNIWSKHFKKENLIIRCYELTQLKNGDIVEDFLEAIGAPVKSVSERPKKFVNISENIHFLELCRAVNNLENVGAVQKTQLKGWIRSQFNEGEIPPFTKQSIISPKEELEILRKYESDNEFLAREFLNRSDGRLFFDPGPDVGREDWKPYDGMPPEVAVMLLQNVYKKTTH